MRIRPETKALLAEIGRRNHDSYDDIITKIATDYLARKKD
jgi:hypothetical protein